MTGPFWEYFLFYGLAGFFLQLGLKESVIYMSQILSAFPWNFGGSFNSSHHINCLTENPGSTSSPGVWHEIRSSVYGDLRPQKNYIFHSYFHWRKKLLPFLGFWPIIRPLSSSFALSSDSFGLLYWPLYIPFFIHPVREGKHLLAFILTWICYFVCEELTYSSYYSFNGQSLAAC